MAEREFSTVDHERLNNPRLQIADRDAFIRLKVSENHYQPPYFRLMERLNMEGGEAPPAVTRPRSLSLQQLNNCNADHLVDIREPMAYASSHLPGAMSLPVDMISAFAGWFFREGKSLALIASDKEQLATAMEHLVRIALDNVLGGYVGVVSAAKQGEEMQQTPMIGTTEVENRLNDTKGWTLLDVRDADERATTAIEASQHIYVGHLNERWHELDSNRHYTPLYASGERATIAAGWLASRGFDKLDIYIGGMSAWKAAHE
ncbi:rhodanese-like domain-containing protein [Psychrobacter urativorans]|uniref:rhodanese-like domain-containing protein n=1 Tax=Psychrobacter urativorans TaxID=45610 RepID=UPI0022340D82|nr:rhodanese-like domain-containing protein [Psychrobacter urativorans]